MTSPRFLNFTYFLDKLVRADDDVYLPIGQSCKRLSLLLGRTETGQFGNFYRPFVCNQAEAVGKILEVLLGQQRGRHQNRYLSSIGHCQESGAQGHFGLAKTHIAANQPVHRFIRSQILDYGFDGGSLVGSFFEAEAFDKCIVILLPEGERMARGEQLR